MILSAILAGVSKCLLLTLSPLDSRYHSVTSTLLSYFSEKALAEARVFIELSYLIFLSKQKIAPIILTKNIKKILEIVPLSQTDWENIKQIESEIHHDVKAIEYFLQKKLMTLRVSELIPLIHFGLTSEDINNLAYRKLIAQAQQEVIMPQLKRILRKLSDLADKNIGEAMLARTHGQSAVPTTLGKELSVFAIRILDQLKAIEQVKLQGKLNGAVGSFQALQFVLPQVNWISLSKQFVKSLDLEYKLHTTQINPPDDLLELFYKYHHLNSIILGLNQDLWRYISDDWLIQNGKQRTVGSSTMPQKMNPIEFENSEGNLNIANGLWEVFLRKLPISRLQRDLSDSTVMRNVGVAFAHSLIAYHSLEKGLDSISAHHRQLTADLLANWNILAEAMNVVGRLKGAKDSYEQAAKLFKGNQITALRWREIALSIGDSGLAELSPQSYIGLTKKITQRAVRSINNYLAKELPRAKLS